jgi:hypothetical protein
MTSIIDASYEPIAAVAFTVIFIILIRARMDKYKGGQRENPFVFAALLIVPVMMHAWHLLFGEGSIVEYGGTTILSIFSIDSSEWIITGNFMEDGIGLDGALLNTYQVTVSLYMLIAYSIVHIIYKDSSWLVPSDSRISADSSLPGIIFIGYFFIMYSGLQTAIYYFLGLPTFSDNYVLTDWQLIMRDAIAFLATSYVLMKAWMVEWEDFR